MKLSIVATLYGSEKYIPEFHRRATAAARARVGDDYEIILVNDGSPDGSLAIAVRLAEEDPHLAVIDFSRNFGHHKAIMAGLEHAAGDRVFLLDSDLEEEPEWLAPFSERMDTDGCDTVFGVQEKRKGGWMERLTGHVFYILYEKLTGISTTKNHVTARLMTRRYLDGLLRHREREITLGGLYVLTGFEQRAFPITKHSLNPTTYTFRRKIALLTNSIASFSNKPLIGIFYSGLVMLALSLSYVAYLVITRLFTARPILGWTSVMASIWLLGSLIILSIGTVGIYLAKIFLETKQRPNHIIRRYYGKPLVSRI